MLEKWLLNGLAKKGKTGRGLARALGLDPSQISRMLSGKRRIQANELAKIAAYLGEPVPNLDGPAPRSREGLSEAGLVEVEMAGTLEAGRFFPAEYAEEPAGKKIPMPVGKRYAGARYKAWKVRGDSMDRAGIIEGDHVIAAETIDTGWHPIDDQIVVLQRSRDGGDIERTVKKVKVYSDRIEFVPVSSNPRHEPIVVSIDHGYDFGPEIAVIGVVTRIIRDI